METVTSMCLHCRNLVPVEPGADQEFQCRFCGTRQKQLIYPAYTRAVEIPEPVPAAEGASSCYFHPTVSAEHLCDDCGRYLCDLCTLDMPMPPNEPADFPERVCPACFEYRVEEEQRSGQWDLFRTTYRRYDITVLSLTLLPLLAFVFLTVVTFPIAIYLVLRHGRTCRTPVQHLRKRLTFGLVLASAGSIVWLSILVFSLVNAF